MNIAQKIPLRRGSMDLDPLKQFIEWYQEAEQAEIPQANAMTLATSSEQGKPAARIVLLRGLDERGFVFFTNYESRKAEDLGENPKAALMFWWQPLSRQVRVEGWVEQVEADESDLYFSNRPRGHQIEAHASAQSQTIQNRAALVKQFAEVSKMFEEQEVPRPPHWGGYRVVPELLEFWQEGENRLHDRLRYRRDSAGDWAIERLAP
ncbi:pyridoxamine 5'-phosphate oxidase [Geopsychrobacter electrodiphilus]|uniref:pyridoxamine 5'-phosphate oxidase n=1 Tax=Geopsychrobacter electrodiphilus TaxID=225196 RepID=UPI00036230EE|nr:pyridoxamine 5'-phosphate oxidase [Geopsychrobacter electrodiphilus]